MDDEKFETIDIEKHDQLLRKISSFNSKGASTAKVPQRSYDSMFVSSSHKIQARDLLKSTSLTIKHGELRKQLSAVQRLRKKKAARVSLPLDEQDKIERTVAYDQACKQISRWDPVVREFREAEQLRFSLENTNQINGECSSHRFKPRTNLEKRIASVISECGYDLTDNSELTEREKEVLNSLSIEEAKERQALLRKHNLLISYAAAKAKRQKKIKSKSYHRFLRKEKMKKELQEMERLKQLEPEEYLERLKAIENDRIKERMSLKHRGGGKFARRNAIYAKYDNQTREAIQEMIKKNKELIAKDKASDDDSETYNSSDSESENMKATQGRNSFDETSLSSKTADSKGHSNPWLKPEVHLVLTEQCEKVSEEKHNNVVTGISNKEENNQYSESSNGDLLNKLVGKSNHLKKGGKKRELDTNVIGEKENVVNSNKSNSAGRKRKKSRGKRKIFKGVTDGKRTNVFNEKQNELDVKCVENSSKIPQKTLMLEKRNKEAFSEKENNLKTINDISKRAGKKSNKSNKVKSVLNTQKDKVINVINVRNKYEETPRGTDESFSIAEAFADDDVIAEFTKEKESKIHDSMPKSVDLTIPGWGSWCGPPDTLPKKRKSDSRRMILNKKETPPSLPRKDQGLNHVIINEKLINHSISKFQVSDLPFPFKNVREFEKSISHPIGKDWNSESSVRDLTKPRILTKLGHIIKPIDSGEVFDV